VPALFAFTMFLSATLLFMVQPMVGKMVLPHVGGSPAVWNTCMVFFQTLLLLGYLYAHKLASLPSQKSQVKIHIAVLCTAAAVLAIASASTHDSSAVPILKSLAPSGGGFPFLEVLAMLAISIAVPFFAVSTSAPLLQRWFTVTGHPGSKDPYFLYAASNAGSLISLLGYPLLMEPSLRVVHQTWFWAAGFVLLVFATWQCGRASLNPVLPSGNANNSASTVDDPAEPTDRRKFLWLLRAFVPSSLMLGVTTYMTTDIASVPLLWVIPLALYLLTLIIAFANTPWWYRPLIANAAPVVVLLLVFVLVSGVLDRDGGDAGISPMLMKLTLHLSAYFLLSLLMHSELAHERPPPKYLTSYFLWISLGGVCGGLFNALFAPLVFKHPYEYSLAIALGCMLVPALDAAKPPKEITEDERNRKGWAVILDFTTPAAMVAFISFMLWLSNREFFNSACRMIVEQLHLGMATVRPFIMFAPPCLICFLFIDRPLRFGLCVLALLGVHEYRSTMADNSSRSRSLRSYFGIVRIDTILENDSSPYLNPTNPAEAKEWAVYGVAEVKSMSHGTTLHGKQFKSRFRTTTNGKLVRAYLEDPDANREVFLANSIDTGLPPAFSDDLRILSSFGPLQAAVLVGAKNAWDPTKDPLTYYHRTGPVGMMMAEAYRRKPSPAIGMVGLGTGSAAAYALPGQTFNFYEIDSKVRDMVLAGKDFTYVNDAKARGANIDIIMGDARLMLERDPDDRKYDLLLIDAFSSDSIPVHLLTVESLKLYQQRLKPGGIFAMHISNQYLRLEPVVAAIAKQNGYACRVLNDRDLRAPGKTASSWVILAENEETLGKAFTDPEELPGTFTKPDWRPLEFQELVKPWTDDYQDMLMVLGIKEVQAVRRWFGLPTLAP